MLISNNSFDGSVRVGRFYLEKRYFQNIRPDIYVSIRGVLTEDERRKIADWVQQETTNVPADLLGLEYSAISINLATNTITAISDISGKHLIYYSTDGSTFGFEFWEVVCVAGKTAKDVNPLGLKRQLIFGSDVTGGTFVSGIRVVPSASIARFSDGEKPSFTRYWYFKKDERKRCFSDKRDSFLNVLDENVKRAVRVFNSPKRVAVGLSGGLDSRLIPWLCGRHGLSVAPFIICDPRPNGVFEANDLAKSKLLADIFGVDLRILDVRTFDYKYGTLLDSIQAPMCSSQVFKLPPDAAIKGVESMLTGASGYIVGSSPFYGNAEDLNLMETIFRRQSLLGARPPYHRVKRGLNYLFATKFNVAERVASQLPGVMSHAEYEIFVSETRNYLSSFDDVDDTDKLMNYAIGVLGRRNYSGGFESLSRRVNSISIYDPNVILEVQKWSNEDIYNRKFFEEFLYDIAPQLVEIRGQDYKVSIANRQSGIFAKIAAVGELAVRGQGVMNYKSWIKSSEFRSVYKELLIDQYHLGGWIDVEAVEKNVMHGYTHPSIITDLLKINTMVGFLSKFPNHIGEIREIRSRYGNR